MRRYLPFAIVALVACLTVGGSALLYRAKERHFVLSGASAAAAGKLKINPSHVRGAPDAPVTLEEFADFQCPSCQITSGVLREVEKDYGPRLRVVFWHFPLPMHAHGREAALAAEAASLQGRFWEMNDLLYENQKEWSVEKDIHSDFERYANQLHLDVPRFEKDMAGEAVANRVEAERAYGAARGVQNTPSLFINNTLMAPPFSSVRLHQILDAAIAENKEAPEHKEGAERR